MAEYYVCLLDETFDMINTCLWRESIDRADSNVQKLFLFGARSLQLNCGPQALDLAESLKWKLSNLIYTLTLNR